MRFVDHLVQAQLVVVVVTLQGSYLENIKQNLSGKLLLALKIYTCCSFYCTLLDDLFHSICLFLHSPQIITTLREQREKVLTIILTPGLRFLFDGSHSWLVLGANQANCFLILTKIWWFLAYVRCYPQSHPKNFGHRLIPWIIFLHILRRPKKLMHFYFNKLFDLTNPT